MNSLNEWNSRMTAEHHTSLLARYGAKQREWTDRRNGAIVQARRDGLSFRDIAEAVGLSHTAVVNIVKRNDGG